jgi:hypothetical protein
MISQLCRISAALSAAIVAGQGQRNQALRRIFRRTQLDRGAPLLEGWLHDHHTLVPSKQRGHQNNAQPPLAMPKATRAGRNRHFRSALDDVKGQ